MSKWVNQVEMAEILGVSRNSVSKAIANGRLPESTYRTIDTAGSDRYEIDIYEACIAWKENRDNRKVRTTPTDELDQDDPDDETLDRSTRRRVRYQSMREMLAYFRETGDVVATDFAVGFFFKMGRRVRNKLLRLPNSLPARLHDRSEREIKVILNDAITDALAEIDEGIDVEGILKNAAGAQS